MNPKQQAVLVYKGVVVDLDTIPADVVSGLMELSPETQQERLKEIFDSIPDVHKATYGYCKDAKLGRQVTYLDCVNCGISKNLKTKKEWAACVQLNLTK